MAKLKIRGRISFIPGPWGLDVRGKQLPIRIIDIHPINRTRQTIWQGKTNNSGDFSGTTKDWRDMVTIPTPPIGTTTIPDPTDLLMLMIEVTIGNRRHEQPFPFISDNVLVPIILPFPPEFWKNNSATINDALITDTQKLSDELLRLLQNRQPKVTLKLYGNWANSAQPIVDIIRETPLKRVQRVFPLSTSGSIVITTLAGMTITLTAPAILATASLILAIGGAILLSGAAIFVILLGIAVIVAVLMGYATIKAEQKTQTNTDGSTENYTVVEFGL